MKKVIFLADGRFTDVDAVGEYVRARLSTQFERRHSDYLGGAYLQCRMSNGGVIRVRSNYSSFLDEWCVEDRPDWPYVILVEGGVQSGLLERIGEFPGFVRYSG